MLIHYCAPINVHLPLIPCRIPPDTRCSMRALSIRQPYAELILRGIKTVEYRSRSTRIIGERFHIYASLKRAAVGALRQAQDRALRQAQDRDIWSRDLAMPSDALPRWMIELAEQVGMIEAGALLPTGVIVGSAVISRCEALSHEGTEARSEGQGGRHEVNSPIPDPFCTPACLRASVPSCLYAWHLADVQRAKRFRKPKGSSAAGVVPSLLIRVHSLNRGQTN
jgi:hypothetical protein